MADASGKVNVTIVGGGIAGLTAALRLAESGCKVTVYEEAKTAGGNMGKEQGENTRYNHDVYPHMFGTWYKNFWKLVEDLGLSRERDFTPIEKFAALKPNDFPNFKFMMNSGSVETIFPNVLSGMIPVPDAILMLYSAIDLLSHDFSRGDILSKQTVNGFITSRPYATKKMAEMHDILISNIWSVNSYLASAYAYQSFMKHQIFEPTPQCWVLKGNAYEHFITPLVDRLKALNCMVNTGKTVDYVTIADGKVVGVHINPSDAPPSEDADPPEMDYLILAVPPTRLAGLVQATKSRPAVALKRLVQTNDTGSNRSENEPSDTTIVDVLPDLSELHRLSSEPIPIFELCFRKPFPKIPSCYVSLMESQLSLTFVKIPYRSSETETVLAVAISNAYALPGDLSDLRDVYNLDDVSKQAPALARSLLDLVQPDMSNQPQLDLSGDTASDIARITLLVLKELKKYIPFNESDMDLKNSFFLPNNRHQLFINEVGSEQWRPKTKYSQLSNLFFAGDYCENPITIATVEAAVVSGLQAANAVVGKENIGEPIIIIEPSCYPESYMAALKIIGAPYALAAKCWSSSLDSGHGGLLDSAASLSAEGATTVAFAAMGWWDAMLSVYGWKR